MRLRARISMMWTRSSSPGSAAASAAVSTASASSNSPSSCSASPSSSPAAGDGPADQRRPRQPLDLGEVVAVAGQAGGPHEEAGVGRAGGLQPGRRHPDRVLPPAGAVGVDAVGVLQQEAPALQHRQAGPQDLAVEGVGQGDLLAAALGAHGRGGPSGRAAPAARRRRSPPGSRGWPAPRRPGRRGRRRRRWPPCRAGPPPAPAGGGWRRAARPAATRPAGRPGGRSPRRRAPARARTGRCPCWPSRSR